MATTTRRDALANAAELLQRAKVRSYGTTPTDLTQCKNLTSQAEAWLNLAQQLADEAQVQRNLMVFGPSQPAFTSDGGYSDAPPQIPGEDDQ